MNTNTWKYVKPLKNRSAVNDFLSKYNVALPKELIQIIETYNGGRPSIKDIHTSTGREYVFKSLLSYNPGDKETIYSVYPDLFKKSDLFPIGTDAAGNFICYEINSKQYILLNHETNAKEIISGKPFGL